jgi:hypothetical protein
MADGFTSTRRTRQSRQRDEARISSQRLASSGGLASAQHSMEHDPISSGVNHAKVRVRPSAGGGELHACVCGLPVGAVGSRISLAH